MADLFDGGDEIVCREKPDVTLAKRAAAHHLSLEFIVLAEEKVFAHPDLASWPDQAFPLVSILRELARQQNFNPAAQELTRRGIVRADRVRL